MARAPGRPSPLERPSSVFVRRRGASDRPTAWAGRGRYREHGGDAEATAVARLPRAPRAPRGGRSPGPRSPGDLRFAWHAGAPGDATPPVVEHVPQGLGERKLRLPADRPLDAAGVAQEDRDIGRAQPRRILPHRDGAHGGLADEEVQNLADGPRFPRTQVVDLAGLAPLQEQPVAPHDVAYVREVALGLERAHMNDGLAEPGLDLRDLPGEVGRDEHVAAPGPLVVEGAAAHDG